MRLYNLKTETEFLERPSLEIAYILCSGGGQRYSYGTVGHRAY